MWWHYLLVFLGSFLVDVLPFPLPPAFTIMIFCQIKFDLNIWFVLVIGVAGSVAGRYLLTLYLGHFTGKLFKPSKNEDVHFLGDKLKQKGWKGQTLIFLYCMMPLPSTPLFFAAGMAKVSPNYVIIPFIIGKFLSDMILVISGKYAAENTSNLLEGTLSWKSITGLGLGLILVFILLFIDWRSLLQDKKFRLKFDIWK